MRHALRLACLSPLLVAASFAAQASTTVFSDSFEATALGLNQGPAGWSVSGGSVDVVGPGLFGELCLGSGRCIDLDGSTGQAGLLSISLSLNAGQSYLLSFDLAGNRRGAGNEQVQIGFGSASSLLGFADASPSAAWQSHSLLFTPASSGNYTLSFKNIGGDNRGAMLDNINVSAVPEPAAQMLMLGGLLVMGLLQRRRTR
jgi:hypothetical protein